MWLAAIAAGAVHALAHGASPGESAVLAAGLLMLYAAGDWVQSSVAHHFALAYRGRSDPHARTGYHLLVGGATLAGASGVKSVGLTWSFVVLAALVPAILAGWLRAALPPFDRRLLGLSSFALSAPAFLFGALAAPRCLRCATAFWSLPAIGYPVLTLLISTRLPAPPVTVKRLGWLAAALTVLLAACWVALFR